MDLYYRSSLSFVQELQHETNSKIQLTLNFPIYLHDRDQILFQKGFRIIHAVFVRNHLLFLQLFPSR